MTSLPSPGQFREAVIDLGAISHNVRTLRERVGTPNYLAVVKANAYGHGMIPVARAALSGGATHLGVADIGEALILRRAGIDAPILAWLHDADEDFREAVSHRITVCVSSVSQLDALSRAAADLVQIALVHIKVDTGLSRNGVALADLDELCVRARECEESGHLIVEGIFSHLSNASDEDDQAQARLFDEAVRTAREVGLAVPIRHLAASEAALTLPELAYDMVRVGIAMYGISPMEDCAPGEFGLEPVMTLRARVAAVRRVPEGTGVSYNYTYRTANETTLALVPLGYGEGIPRSASGRGPVVIGGTRLTISGRVAMDQFVVDCGECDVNPGDEVVLFGNPAKGFPSIHDWAAATDTIGYEVVTRLGGRLTYTFIDS